MVTNENKYGRKSSKILRYGIDYRRRRDETAKPLDSKDIDLICRYLENPTKCGIWYLHGKWERDKGISQYILGELNQEFKVKEDDQIKYGKKSSNNDLNGIDKNELFDIVNRVTYTFDLFTSLYYLENEQLEAYTPYYPINDTIFEIVDLEKFKNEYKEAYECFKTDIHFDGFNPMTRPGEINIMKDGFFTMNNSLNDSTNFSLMSLNHSSLEKLQIFFTKLGKVSDISLSPIYSPEEKVFTPYFSLLGEVYMHFIDHESVKILFEKATKEYSNKNYTYCVSTIGLIAEDYLIQIYETFFRDICPKGRTLGQTYDLIHTKIQQKFEIKSKATPEIKPLYNKINKLIDEELDGNGKNEATLKLLRDVLNYIKDDKTHTHSLITDIEKKKERQSVFPKYLRENVNELIRYRNATSHKSRIPIGSYEAIRTVYCCITLLIWWTNEKKNINWKNEQDAILKKSIERNTGTMCT